MKKVQVIAHRGGFLPEGPIPEVKDKYTIPENTLEAFKRAFENGWGIETDVRIAGNGQFILSHDDTHQTTLIKIPTLDELCQLASPFISGGKKTSFIAFQIKRGKNSDDGVEVGRAVARQVQKHNLQNIILFDATFEEAKTLHAEFPWLNLSISVGEENYSPTIYTPSQALTTEFTSVYKSVWVDEWKIAGSVYNQTMFKRFQAAYSGRIDVISPELHYNENHPMAKDLEKLKSLWKEIINWNIATGICTDYPTELNSIF